MASAPSNFQSQSPTSTAGPSAAAFPTTGSSAGVPVARVEAESPAFWPAVLAAANSNRRARIILDGSSCVGVARVDSRTTMVRVKVIPDVLAACRSSAAELEAIASQVAGKTVKIEAFADEPVVAQDTTPRANINEHPLVKSAMELFKARLLSVQPRQPIDK